MAIAFTKTGQPDEAIRHYKRALELDATLVGAHYGVAFLLLKRGDGQQAAEHLRAFLARPPKGPDAERWVRHAETALRDIAGTPAPGDAVSRWPSCSSLSRRPAAAVWTRAKAAWWGWRSSSPTIPTVEVGEQLQLSARALDADGELVAATIVWRAGDAALTVDADRAGHRRGARHRRVQAVVGSLSSELVAFTVIAPADTLIIVG